MQAALRAFELLLLREIGLLPALDAQTLTLAPLLPDARYCLPDEAGLARSLGLDYTHIPVPFDAPAVDDFRAFRATMDRLAGKRVLVHCAANFRVTSFVALWGEAAQGWPTERADALARTFWEPNETWQRFLADCRASRQPGF